MTGGPWKPRTLLRYTLLQLPAAALAGVVLVLLGRWFDLAGGLLWTLFLFWLAKDVLLYPLVWKAYDPAAPARSGSLVGKTGVVRERLAPAGYVEIQGELWQAELADPAATAEVGARVVVTGLDGLTLTVAAGPAAAEESSPDPAGGEDTGLDRGRPNHQN